MKRREEDPFRLRGYWFERVMMSSLALFLLAIPVFLTPMAGPEDIGLLIFIYSFLGLMLIIPLTSLYRSLTWLQVYKEGILINTPLRRDRFLAWEKIASIRSWVWGSDLILSDSTGKIKASVYSSHSNSHYFIGWLINQRPDIWRPADGLTFTNNSINSLLWVAISVVGLWSAIASMAVNKGLFWIFLAVALVGAGALLVFPYSVSIIGDAILLRYPFRKRMIHADQIRCIETVYGPSRHVLIRMKKGEMIHLWSFSLGSEMLFAFLWSWHDSKARPKLDPPPSGALAVFRVPPRLLEPPKLNPPMYADE